MRLNAERREDNVCACRQYTACTYTLLRRENILCAVGGVNLSAKDGPRRQPVGKVDKRSRFYIKIENCLFYLLILFITF